jgi:chromosome segregation ATPase
MDQLKLPDGDDDESLIETENAFSVVVGELLQHRSLDRFRDEYQGLHEAFVHSREQNLILARHCRKLNAEIVANANKIASMLIVSQNNQRTIANLRSEFKKAWKAVDYSLERENRTKAIITNLRADTENLKGLIEGGTKHLSPQPPISRQSVEDSIRSLAAEVKLQDRQRDELAAEITESQAHFRAESNSLREVREQLESVSAEASDLVRTSEQLQREQRETTDQSSETCDQVVSAQKDVEQRVELMAQRQMEVRGKERELNEVIDERRAQEDRLRKRRNHFHDLRTKRSELAATVGAIEQRVSDAAAKLDTLSQHSIELNSQLADLDVELTRSRREQRELFELRRATEKEGHQLFFVVKELQKSGLTARTDLRAVVFGKQIKRLELDILARKKRQMKQRVEDEVHQTDTTVVERDQVEREIGHIKRTRHQQQTRYNRVTKETCHDHHEIAATQANLLILEDDTFQTQLELDNGNSILRQRHEALERHEAVCEEIRAEREALARSAAKQINDNKVIEDEICSMGHEITKMKDALLASDTVALELHVMNGRVREHIKHYSRDIDRLTEKLRKRNAEIDDLRSKIECGRRMIEQGAIEHGYQQSIIDQYRQSHEYIAREVRTKQRETDLVREKENVLMSLIRIGNSRFETLSDRIEVLEDAHEDEIWKEHDLVLKMRHCQSVKAECLRLERLVLHAMCQACVLEDDAKVPRNIHRWTLLKSGCPDYYELISMRQTLLEVINDRRDRLGKLRRAKSELEIKMEKMSVRLHAACGYVFQTELAQVSQMLSEKTRQLSAMESRFHNRKPTVDVQHGQLRSVQSLVRKKNLEDSEDRQKSIELRQAVEEPDVQIRPPKHPPSQRAPGRFIGGGFNVGKVENIREDVPALNLVGVEMKPLRARPGTSRTKAVFAPTSARRGPNQNRVARPASTRVYRE